MRQGGDSHIVVFPSLLHNRNLEVLQTLAVVKVCHVSLLAVQEQQVASIQLPFLFLLQHPAIPYTKCIKPFPAF